jgi:Putative adhesin
VIKQRIWVGAVIVLMGWSWGRAFSMRNRYEAKARQDFTLPREGAHELELRSPAGNIRVVAGDRDQIRVDAEKRVRADRESDAEAFLAQMKIDRRRDGDRWIVEATWPEPRRHDVESPYINFEIQVPRGMSLAARTGGGNMEAEGIGEARLRTGGGNVTAREVSGLLDVNTGGGNIETTGGRDAQLHTGGGNISARSVEGRLKAHTGGGNIEVQGSVGPVEVDTGGGNITIRRAESPVKATTGAGNVEVEVARARGAAQVELGTGAGDLMLHLPEGVDARVEADTGLGRVDIEPSTNARFNRGRTHAEAVLGDGRGSVRLHTGVGGVRVRLAGR